MFVYYGKTYKSERAGVCVVGVECEQCKCTYYYELARIGTGAHTASYGIGSSTAPQKAQDQSQADLQERLRSEAELVPCPKCNWINTELVNGYRRTRYQGCGALALLVGFVGTTISLIASWYINIGPPIDRWLLPYLLIGAPAGFIGISIVLLVVRRWLRARIQPNREFPREPRLPPGTPPALQLDEQTQILRPAVRNSEGMDELLDFQVGRSILPPLCCECLQAADEGCAWPINVTKLLELAIPRCAACAGKANFEMRRIFRTISCLGLLVGVFIVVVMVRASVHPSIIIFSSLGLLIFTVVLMAIVVGMQTAPVKVVKHDSSRGVVRLRFRNPAYVVAIAQFRKDMVQES